MKTKKSIGSLIFLALLCISCAGVKEIYNDKKMKDISPLHGELELTIGEKASYTGSVHGSVGTQKECWSSDEKILKLVDKDFKYNKPQVPGETGGDAAKETYIFEALSVGTTEVTIQDWFRGALEHEYKVKISVTE